jgi:UDP-GlcNAc:undecaprenyl-phosphate GlcNAc-1-phosphate transferase
MIWIVGVINAINLIDGMDGLAGGIIVLASLSSIVILMIDHNWSILLFVLALLGSVLGFLPFNHFPSKIFMGDGGSLFAGAILATALIRTSQKGALGITILVPLIILALPVLDTASAFFRRLLHGQSPFRADSMHIHHRLMHMGFSEEATVNILLIVSGICSVLGIAAYFLNRWVRFFVFVALFVGLLGFLKYMDVVYKKNGNLSSSKWMKAFVRSALNGKLNP